MWAVVVFTALWALVEPCGAGVTTLDALDTGSLHSHGRAEGQSERLIAASKMHCCWSRLGLAIPESTDSGAAVRLRLKTDDEKPIDGAVGRHCSPDTCQHCHTSHNCNRHKKYCKWHALDPNHPKEGICFQRPRHEL